MARSTSQALSAAASVARRALGRGGREQEAATSGDGQAAAPAEETAAKKAPAKKTAAKKAPAKKTAAKKAPAKKTAAKKTAAKKTPAKKAPAAKGAAREKTTRKRAPVKKTSAAGTTQQAPVESLVVGEGEDAWTPAELEEVVGELHQQRTHSLEIIDDQSEELTGLLRDSGDGAGHDQADVGATSFERDHELTVLNSERDKIAQIERALTRIEDGSYGRCESCGQAIGKMRLMAFPRATLCMTCKQREERR